MTSERLGGPEIRPRPRVASRLAARDGRTATRAGVVVAAIAGVVYVSLLLNGAGVEEGTIRTSWQLLDLGLLEDEPVRSLWLLHTQPPLYNALAAALVRLPFEVAASLTAVFGLTFVLTSVLCFDLVRRLGASPVVAAVATIVAIGNPNLLSTVRIASYEVLVAFLAVAVAWLLLRFLQTGRDDLLLALSTALTVAALTRSLLHPVWVGLVLAAALLVRRPARPGTWVAAIGLPLALIGGLALKNAVVFGEPTLSSWSGFNTQRGIVAPMTDDQVEAAIEDGAATELAAMPPWLSLRAYDPVAEDCTPRHDDAVVADPVKDRVGVFTVPNFNHECYIPLYGESADNAAALVRREPGRYLSTRAASLGLSFATTGTGTDDARTAPTGEDEPDRSWMDGAYRPLLLPVSVEIGQSDWNLPLYGGAPVRFHLSLSLLAAYVLVVGVSATRLVRVARDLRHPLRWRPEDVTWVVVGLTVVLVVVGGAMVEFGENGRFRAALDPLVVALALTTAWTGATRVVAAARSRRTTPVVAGTVGARRL